MSDTRSLSALQALALATLLGACSKEHEPPVKVLLVGIDGATWRVVDPLLARGELPTFARLIQGGVRAPLQSQDPMFSPAIWTTIATGRNRSEHGIVHFGARRSDPRKVELVGARDRHDPALWTIASHAGASVGVVGWWVTWPAEGVKGWLVSDRVAYSRWQSWTGGERSTGLTWPEDLIDELRPLIVDPVRAPLMDEIRALASFDAEELAAMERADHPLPSHGPSVLKFGWCEQRTYERIVLHQLAKGQPDLTSVFLVAVDPVSHTFWHCYEPAAFPGVDAAQAERLGDLVPAVYRHDDRVLAELLAKVGADTVVLVVSDHGFQASGKLPGLTSEVTFAAVGLSQRETVDVPVNLGTSGIHRLDGLFLASGKPFVSGAVPKEPLSVLDVTPTVLALLGLPIAKNMPGRVPVELFDPAWLAEHPLQFVDDWRASARPLFGDESGEHADDAGRMEQLKALGYIDLDEDEPQR